MELIYSQRPSRLVDFFVTFPGSEPVSGLTGINTLLSHLQSDVKKILKKYSISKPSKKWRELQEVIKPYKKDWEAFIRSDMSPLTEKQIKLIKYSRIYDDRSIIAEEIKSSLNQTSISLHEIINKLHYPDFIKQSFDKWQLFKNEDLDSLAHFLTAPIEVHRAKMSDRLFRILRAQGENMKEILEKLRARIAERKQHRDWIRGFGKKSMDELKKILRKYHSSKLLK